MNEDTLKLNLSPIATEPYNVFNDAPKVKYLTSDDLQRQVRISPDWIENVGIKSTGAYKTPNRIADFGTSVAQGATQIPGRVVQVLAETAGNFLLNPESIPVVTPIGGKTLGSFIPESLTEKLAGYRYPWEPIARRLMTDSFENLQQRDLANELYAMQKGIDPEQWQNELGRALGESWLYAGQIAATSAIGAPQIGIGLTMAEMTGDYAHETASQYVERTGDKDFENFTSDDAKLSSALAYGAIGTAIEFTGGVEPLLMGSLKRVGLRSSVGKAILKTGAEEGLEEFAQGMLEQFLRSSDGTATQTWGEAFKESLKGAVYGAVIGGAIGGPAFYINRRNLVKGLRRAFPTATNANLTKIANTMIETAANQTHPDSRLIDNLKAKVRAMYADAEIVDDAIIDSTTNLEYSLISMDALERGIDIAEHPIFQGEVNELGWFREGIPEHRRTEINKYIADINDLTNKIQAENAKETKDWDKIDELETKLEFLRSQSLDRLEGLVIADRAELRKMLQEQQDELTRRRLLRLTQEQARKAAQRQDILDERASERGRRAEEKRIERQNKIELQKALREIRAEQRAQALKNRLMDVARIEAASDESLRAVLIEAGYLKDVVDKLKPRTLRSQVKQLQDANLDLLQSESTRLNQETLNLADENARLDEVNPKYTGETIEVNGVERTVYNSNGDRIAQSEPALRNFYKWFGDSKVVDEQGRPLVVYHGSDVSGIEVFDSQANQTKQRQIGADRGYFFTDSKKVAERFRTETQRKAETQYYMENTVREPVDETRYDAQGRPVGTVHYVKTTPAPYKNFGLYGVYLKAENINEFNGEEIGTGVERDFALASAKANEKDGVIIYNADTGAGIANEYIVFEPNQIKSVNNRGTFSPNIGNIYFQTAYAGSRVDYDRPSLEAIGSGEGNQAHGWGLYYALNPEIALGYMNRFTEYSNPLSFNGKKYEYGKDSEYVPLQELKSGKKTLEQLKIEYQKNVQNLTQYAQEAKESNDAYWERQWTEQAQDAKNVLDFLNGLENITKDDIKIIGGQVHKVDIPEMDVMLDEQKNLGQQSQFVQKAVKKALKEAGITDITENSTGDEIYEALREYHQSAKDASQMLEKYGIKGITYEGRRDGRCFVIFNPESVKVLRKKFDELGNVLFQTQNQTGIERSGPRGAYIPEYRFIQKAATMDASTLSHELAHDWMQENFRWLRSGKASPEFKEMWGGVERALGIRENELRVPQKASEEFARAYEGWILNRKDWTKGLNVDGSDRDKMVKAFESYQAELRDIYDSLQNKYFKQTWGEYAQLKPEIESWFERQLNITDVDARERRGELTPAQANQERIDNAINQLIENGDKDIQGLKEIQTLNDTSRYEVPGGNKNSLQERLGILAKEIDENGMLVNPKYDTHRDMMKVAQDADTFVKNHQQDALDIINGIKPETDGLFASDLYTALERLAIENSDMNLFEELRTSEMANRIARELGQRVAGFRQMKADGVDVMSAIKSLDRQYAKIAERNNAQIEEALELYEQAINNQDAKEMKNLDKFLSELECK